MSEQKTFLQTHAFTLAAILLPLVVAGLFLFASALPKYLVDDPKYKLLLTIDVHQGNAQPLQMQFSVKQGKLSAVAVPQRESESFNEQQLYLFDPLTGALELIALDLPPEIGDKSQVIPLPDPIKALTLSTGITAPDGYTFNQGYRHGSGLFGEIFGMGGDPTWGTIAYQGRVIEIKSSATERYRYYYTNVRLLGWTEA